MPPGSLALALEATRGCCPACSGFRERRDSRSRPLDCHPEPAPTKTRELLDSRRTNVYMIQWGDGGRWYVRRHGTGTGGIAVMSSWSWRSPRRRLTSSANRNGWRSSPFAPSLSGGSGGTGVTVAIDARFTHVNLIARDWRRLAEFYTAVLGSHPVPPERDLSGQWLDRATGIPHATIRGVHLRLPGHGAGGPTLEIFQYDPAAAPPAPALNRPGFGHVAFAVSDVSAARAAVLAAGGGVVGELVSADIPGAGRIRFVYATDPEGNVVELQQWSR